MTTALTSASAPLAEINITPLVDVMLVLLVIFMVTAPTLADRLTLNLPQSVDRVIERNEPHQLLVTAGDIYRFDGVVVSRNELRAVLEQSAKSLPQTVVKIEVDSGLDYQDAVTAMATVRNAGIIHFSIDVE